MVSCFEFCLLDELLLVSLAQRRLDDRPVGYHRALLNTYISKDLVEGFLAYVEVRISSWDPASTLIQGSEMYGLTIECQSDASSTLGIIPFELVPSSNVGEHWLKVGVAPTN